MIQHRTTAPRSSGSAANPVRTTIAEIELTLAQTCGLQKERTGRFVDLEKVSDGWHRQIQVRARLKLFGDLDETLDDGPD